MKKKFYVLFLMLISFIFIIASCAVNSDMNNIGSQNKTDGSEINGVSDQDIKAASAIVSRSAPAMASDSSGNTVIVWTDNRNGTNNYDIYAQKLNSSGQRVWASADVKINSDTGTLNQYAASIAVDKSGNTIVVWQDFRNSNGDIFAQKLDASGKKLWSADIKVNSDTSSALQLKPAVAADPSGNFFIVWIDARNGYKDLYSQKLNTLGKKLWTSDIKVNSTAGLSSTTACSITSDASGNAVVVWDYIYVAKLAIQAQKLDAAGKKLWTEVKVGPKLSMNVLNPIVIIDKSGNAVISWEGEYDSGYAVYVQKVNASGINIWTQEKAVSAIGETGEQAYHKTTVDGSGNIINVWLDLRPSTSYLIAQKLDTNGSRVWSASDVKVLAVTMQADPAVAADASGNSIIAWVDNRNGNSNICIYAQKLSSSAAKLWTADVKVNY